jgi:hypothetical protein
MIRGICAQVKVYRYWIKDGKEDDVWYPGCEWTTNLAQVMDEAEWAVNILQARGKVRETYLEDKEISLRPLFESKK